MNRPCARCGMGPRYYDFKFCRRCKDEVEEEMKKSGYLTKTLPATQSRPSYMRENTKDTKGKG